MTQGEWGNSPKHTECKEVSFRTWVGTRDSSAHKTKTRGIPLEGRAESTTHWYSLCQVEKACMLGRTRLTQRVAKLASTSCVILVSVDGSSPVS